MYWDCAQGQRWTFNHQYSHLRKQLSRQSVTHSPWTHKWLSVLLISLDRKLIDWPLKGPEYPQRSTLDTFRSNCCPQTRVLGQWKHKQTVFYPQRNNCTKQYWKYAIFRNWIMLWISCFHVWCDVFYFPFLESFYIFFWLIFRGSFMFKNCCTLLTFLHSKDCRIPSTGPVCPLFKH